MQDILNLIQIYRQRSQRSIQLLNQNFRKKEISKDNQLFKIITDDGVTTEDEASELLYGRKSSDRNFRNTKSKLKQKLLNHLYFLDTDGSGYNSYQKNEYQCHHALHQCRILVWENAEEIAARKLLQLLKDAKLNEFIDVVVESLTLLRKIYSNLGKNSLYNDTCLALNYYSEFLEAVRTSEAIHQDGLIQINRSQSARNKVIEELPGSILKIREFSRKFNSTRIEVIAEKLDLMLAEACLDYEKVIRICEDLEQRHFAEGPSEVVVDLNPGGITWSKLNAHFSLNDSEGAASLGPIIGSYFKSGSRQWFRYQEIFFLLMLRNGQYEEATKLFRKVRTNKNFSKIHDFEVERWNIYRTFLLYVNDVKLLRWGFDLERFISSTPAFPKNYSGYNVAILVIQVMFLLRSGDVDTVREKVRDLEKYNSAHLDKRANYRNSIFIRLLTIMLEKDFNFEEIDERDQNYSQKLQQHPLPTDMMTDLEIIPYEVLWSEIKSMLKEDKRYRHYRFYHLAN